MAFIELKVYIDDDVDLTELLHRISRHAKISLKKENKVYTLEYSGPIETGYLVMDELLEVEGCKTYIVPKSERR
jgi:hypothetical protein